MHVFIFIFLVCVCFVRNLCDAFKLRCHWRGKMMNLPGKCTFTLTAKTALSTDGNDDVWKCSCSLGSSGHKHTHTHPMEINAMPQSSFMLNKHLSKWLNLRCDIKVSSHLRVLAPTIKFILHWFTVHSYDYTHCGCTLLETKDINWTISMAPMNIIPVVTIFFS